MTSSLLVIVGADLVRPSLEWLLTGGKKRKLVRNVVHGRDGAGFDRLRRLCEQDPAIKLAALQDIMFRSAVIAAAKGGTLADITVGDVLEILDAEYAVRGRADSASATETCPHRDVRGRRRQRRSGAKLTGKPKKTPFRPRSTGEGKAGHGVNASEPSLMPR